MDCWQIKMVDLSGLKAKLQQANLSVRVEFWNIKFINTVPPPLLAPLMYSCCGPPPTLDVTVVNQKSTQWPVAQMLSNYDKLTVDCRRDGFWYCLLSTQA